MASNVVQHDWTGSPRSLRDVIRSNPEKVADYNPDSLATLGFEPSEGLSWGLDEQRRMSLECRGHLRPRLDAVGEPMVGSRAASRSEQGRQLMNRTGLWVLVVGVVSLVVGALSPMLFENITFPTWIFIWIGLALIVVGVVLYIRDRRRADE